MKPSATGRANKEQTDLRASRHDLLQPATFPFRMELRQCRRDDSIDPGAGEADEVGSLHGNSIDADVFRRTEEPEHHHVHLAVHHPDGADQH